MKSSTAAQMSRSCMLQGSATRVRATTDDADIPADIALDNPAFKFNATCPQDPPGGPSGGSKRFFSDPFEIPAFNGLPRSADGSLRGSKGLAAPLKSPHSTPTSGTAGQLPAGTGGALIRESP
jgi:hypothetical protein